MLIRVKVLLLQVEGELRDGTEVSLAEGSSMGDLVSQLCSRYPLFKHLTTDSSGSLLSFIRVVMGGRVRGKDTVLINNEEVAFYPVMAGG